MALTTLAKTRMNRCLQHVNLRLDTLTAERIEDRRLEALEQGGHFVQPPFPLPLAFESMTLAPLLGALSRYKSRFDDFAAPSRNDVRYTFDNDYFSSPDAEVLYTMVRTFQPQTVIEVGSGYSTKITRQALLDGQLHARLISIDPHPRLEIRALVDEFYLEPVEALRHRELFRSLQEGDILFIDSSHEIKTGNDVVFLYVQVIPALPPGVLIHIHDVFLPYDYPREWVVGKRLAWNEQYLVQCLLTCSSAFEVLWAGHYLHRTQADFAQYFPHLNGRVATSLWLRKTS